MILENTRAFRNETRTLIGKYEDVSIQTIFALSPRNTHEYHTTRHWVAHTHTQSCRKRVAETHVMLF